MNVYPQEFLDIAHYLEIATTLGNGEPKALPLSYWARYTWAKKAGDKYREGRCSKEVSPHYQNHD